MTAILKRGKTGRCRVDNNLHLEIDPAGRRTWGFRFSITGRARWMRLGRVDGPGALTRKEAAQAADEARLTLDATSSIRSKSADRRWRRNRL